MTNDETQKLLELRQTIIDYYNKLEAPNSVSAVTRQTDVAQLLTSVIKSLEVLMQDKVTFA